MANRKIKSQTNEQPTESVRIGSLRAIIQAIIDAATVEERTPDERIQIVDSIMDLVVGSMVISMAKADAFDALGDRLDVLHQYLTDKENDHHQSKDHATALRYQIEKNEVENIKLIYNELKKGGING